MGERRWERGDGREEMGERRDLRYSPQFSCGLDDIKVAVGGIQRDGRIVPFVRSQLLSTNHLLSASIRSDAAHHFQHGLW
jgi:hypothetical protein